MCDDSDGIVLETGINENVVLLSKDVAELVVVQFGGLQVCRLKREPENVGLDVLKIMDMNLVGLTEGSGKPLGIIVVGLQPDLPIFQRNQAANGKNSNLSHLASKHLSKSSCVLNVFVRAND